jgi:hypothetical protein
LEGVLADHWTTEGNLSIMERSIYRPLKDYDEYMAGEYEGFAADPFSEDAYHDKRSLQYIAFRKGYFIGKDRRERIEELKKEL